MLRHHLDASELRDFEDRPFIADGTHCDSPVSTAKSSTLIEQDELPEFVDPEEDFVLDFFEGDDELNDFEDPVKVRIRSQEASFSRDIQFETPAEDFSRIDYCQPFTLSTLPPEIIRVVALFLGPNCILRLSLVCQHFASSLLHEHLFFQFSTRPEFYRNHCYPFSRMQKFLKLKSEVGETMAWRAFFRCTRPACITFISKDAQRVRVFGGAIKMIGLVSDWYFDTECERKELFSNYEPGDEETFNCAMTWPCANVDCRPLCKLIEYVEHHWDNRADEIPKPLPSKIEDLISDYDKRFLEIDQSLLIELIMASNYMNVKDLLDLSCAKVASMLRGKSPEQIREMFGIENDFTPEEEAKIREENKWCEES